MSDIQNPSQMTAKTRLKVVKLTAQEVAEAYKPFGDQFPPILTLSQAAGLAGLKPSTLKRKVSEGCFSVCVKRGKPLLFWRDRFVQQLFAEAA